MWDTGFTNLRQAAGRNHIREATLALIHRGPDQQNVYESARASLGAVRLRIIDLEGGDQPMHSADGGTVVVFNGEIYNHAELRRELQARGHHFVSRCDTETVLHAFLEWDTACFARFRGMFAIALWQESQGRLVLARDRVGIKPLYVYRDKRDLYFGSELKSLFVHPAVERRLSLEGLHYYLSLNYVPCPLTLVEGVEKVPPGHWLEWRNGAERCCPYWSLEFDARPVGDVDAACEELDHLLRESLREHLISDVPVGIWLSGGVDSSTVLHYAAELCSSRLKTFSVTFRGRSFDEGSHARRVADHYGTEHHEFDLNPQADLVNAIESIAYHSDEPGADSGALPVWFLSKLSREHVTVALSGEGADEVFGGYHTYLADRLSRLSRRLPRPLLRLALAMARPLPATNGKIGLDYKVRRFLGGSLLGCDDAHFFWNGAFSEAEKYALLGHNGLPSVGALLAATAPEEARRINHYLWLDQKYYLPDDILYKCDRMSMAHALEVRPPFLDHRIIEFAARLPEDCKVRGLRLKFLLKRLMRGKVPQSVLARRKEGFDIPAHEWMRGPLRELLLDTVNEEAVRDSGVFQWNAVESVIRAHLERRVSLGYSLWGLLTLFLWMKRWKIQSAPAAGEPLFPVACATN